MRRPPKIDIKIYRPGKLYTIHDITDKREHESEHKKTRKIVINGDKP